MTQKETKKLMQSENVAKFVKEATDLENGAVGYFFTALLIGTTTALTCLGNNNDGEHHHSSIIFPHIITSTPTITPSEPQLPVLSDFTNVTVENLHQHITPIKVHIENNSDKTLLISKTEYLSTLQSQSVPLDNIMRLFPKIDDHKSSLRWAGAGLSVATVVGGLAAAYTFYCAHNNFMQNNFKWWLGAFQSVLATCFGFFTVFAAKSGYECWDNLSTLDKLKRHHKNLVDNLTIVYDSATGQELSPDEYSFGYTIPPHAVFESLLFVRTDKCEEYILNAAQQDSMTLNAKQIDMRKPTH